MLAIIAHFVSPDRFVSLTCILFDGTNYRGNLSGPFPITDGLKQGSVLVPTLISLYLAAIINKISSDPLLLSSDTDSLDSNLAKVCN